MAVIVTFAARVVRRSREAAGDSEPLLELHLPGFAEARAVAFVSVKSLAGLAHCLRRTRRRRRRRRRTHRRGWRRRRWAARVADAAGGTAEPILDVVGVFAPAAAAVLLRRDRDVARLRDMARGQIGIRAGSGRNVSELMHMSSWMATRHLGLPLGARVQPLPPPKAGRRLDVDAVLRAWRRQRRRPWRRRGGRAN